MNYRKLLPFTLAACSLGTVSCQEGEEEKPNVLFIIAEDMTLDLGCYGRQDVKTPNIDRLAKEGVMYTNARCCAPLSSPTRSAMLTGLHHTITGSHNHRSNRDKPLPDSIIPFTALLRQAGYTCVLGNRDAFENVNNTSNDQESSRKIDCNFKYERVGEYDGVTSFGLFDCLYDIPQRGPFFNQVTLYVTHRGDWWKSISQKSEHPVDPDSVVLPPYMADHPAIRREFACYLDQVEYMDSEVGRILGELESSGKLDNTIVIFIADNGRADIRAKGFLYEDGTHVPMIVWGKGIKPGVCDRLVSELDITASILYLAGLDRPSYYQGHVLDEVLRPGDKAECGHQYVYTARDTWDEVMECIRGVNDDNFIYIYNYKADDPYDQHHIYMDFYRPAIHIMRKMNQRGELNYAQSLFFADHKPLEELYDYRNDPFCINNLAQNPDFAEVLSRMRGYMKEWNSTYPDLGIEDCNTRVLDSSRLDENRPRYFAKKYHPDEWAEIENGAICDKYDLWKAEMKAAKNRN